MKVFTMEQNSLDWLAVRAGKVTASEMDTLVSPLGEVRKGKGIATYLAQKLAEARLGVLPQYMSIDMEFGKVLEEFALPWYALQYDTEISRPGFISDDAERIGCSPDGLLGEFAGLELKCPRPDTHVKYLLAGAVPDDYILQCQFGMYVTGLKRWRFVSYCRRMPALVLDVTPDPKIQAAIRVALDGFFKQYDAAIARLTELAGEPWQRVVAPGNVTVEPEMEDHRV